MSLYSSRSSAWRTSPRSGARTSLAETVAQQQETIELLQRKIASQRLLGADQEQAQDDDDRENVPPAVETPWRTPSRSGAFFAKARADSPLENGIWRADDIREPLLQSLAPGQPEGLRCQSLRTLINLSVTDGLRREMWLDEWLRGAALGSLLATEPCKVRRLALQLLQSLACCGENRPEMCADEGVLSGLLDNCDASPRGAAAGAGRAAHDARCHALALGCFSGLACDGACAELLWRRRAFAQALVASARPSNPCSVQEQALRLAAHLSSCSALRRDLFLDLRFRSCLLDAARDPSAPPAAPALAEQSLLGSDGASSDSSASPFRAIGADASAPASPLESTRLPSAPCRGPALRALCRLLSGAPGNQRDAWADGRVLDAALSAAAEAEPPATRELGCKLLCRMSAHEEVQTAMGGHAAVLDALAAAAAAAPRLAGREESECPPAATPRALPSRPGAGGAATAAAVAAALRALVRLSCGRENQKTLWSSGAVRRALVAAASEPAPAELRALSLRAIANLTCRGANLAQMHAHAALRRALLSAAAGGRAGGPAAEAAAQALRAVANLATDAAVREEMAADGGGAAAAVGAAGAGAEEGARVQALRCLANLVCAPGSRRALWGQRGFRRAVAEAARVTEPLPVREQALRIMANITSAAGH